MYLINVLEIFSLLTSAFTILFMLISSIYKANIYRKLIQSLINDRNVKEKQPKTADDIVENILKRNEKNYNANNKRKSSAYELHNMDKINEINVDRKKMREEQKLINVKTFDIHQDELPNKLTNNDNFEVMAEACPENIRLKIEEIKKRYGNNVGVCRRPITKENTVEEASSESSNNSN